MEVAAPGSCLEQHGPIFQASTSPQSQKPPPDDACIYGKSISILCYQGSKVQSPLQDNMCGAERLTMKTLSVYFGKSLKRNKCICI